MEQIFISSIVTPILQALIKTLEIELAKELPKLIVRVETAIQSKGKA